MDSRKIVYRETAIVAVSVLALSAVMVGVYAALGYFKISVLWSAVAGSLIMITNYFFMAILASLAADRAEQGDVQQAQKLLQLSSTVRLICMGIALFVAIKLGADVLALVLPFLFVRPTLLLAEFFRKKGDT